MRLLVILVLVAGCQAEGLEAECPPGQERANAGDCVPACLIDADAGWMVYDDVGLATGECRPWEEQ
jgi:hypothetical protein